MTAQALYRRWRPQSFEDVLGQRHVTQTLRNALRTGRLAHAYLFTGPRGTGKTTIARLLAKAACCQDADPAARPCNACGLCRSITEGRCLDVIEIDAASNTGVDDVRELRDRIGFAPNEARYKVYIIDEVHMLSTAAFNALLKTLEEPPAHALFVLATTEPHKIPQTILSRCQRYDLRRVSLQQATEKLAAMCAAEGAVAEPEALTLIARSGTGSLRDAESLLDQLLSGGEAVTVAAVREVLGTPPDEVVAGMIEALIERDPAGGLRTLIEAMERGADARQIQDRLLDHMRAMLLLQTGLDAAALDLPPEAVDRLRDQAARLPAPDLVPIVHRFNQATPAANRALPGLPLELALLASVLELERGAGAATAAPTSPAAAARPGDGGAAARQQVPVAARPAATTAAPAEAGPAPEQPGRGDDSSAEASPAAASRPGDGGVATPAAAGTQDADGLAALAARWGEVLRAVEQRDRNLAALLKDARPVALEAEVLSIGFFYPFHAKRAAQDDKLALIGAAVAAVAGRSLGLQCLVVAPSQAEQAARPRSKTDQAGQDPVVRHALEQMGARISGLSAAEGEPEA